MGLAFFDECQKIMNLLEVQERKNISKAAEIVAEGIINGGVTQAFGSGHSYAGALEISGRAGGMYEQFEGVGRMLGHKMMIQPNDVFFLISNSGRNPMSIELAEIIKAHGNKLIVVTALDISKKTTSRHSNGKLLYEYADVVLDNHSIEGDAALTVDGIDTKVCGTSSFAATLLLQQTMYQAFERMVELGFVPPVYKSANIDGGMEYNLEIEKRYADRIFHI